MPRAFHSYEEYVESVDVLIRSDAVPEPTFLWWDVRPQPRFGTVEVRIMDAQTTLGDTAAIAALVQSIVRLEVEEGAKTYDLGIPPEVLDENRFLAARDGMDAELIAHELDQRLPARALLDDLLVALPPPRRRPRLRRRARHRRPPRRAHRRPPPAGAEPLLGSLPRVVAVLADDFLAGA